MIVNNNTPRSTSNRATSPYSDNKIVVNSISDFPPVINGVITLDSKVSYLIADNIELEGNRLVWSPNCSMYGFGNNSTITSAGLVGPLITSESGLQIANINFSGATCFDVDGAGVAVCFIEGCQFINCEIGTITSVSNYIQRSSTFLNSYGIIFDGVIGTIAFTDVLFSVAPDESMIVLPNTLTITRRFRCNFSAFDVPEGAIGIQANELLTANPESYIIDTVNFAGLGTYEQTLIAADNRSLFRFNTGIENTSVNGQMYMQGNATATDIVTQNVFVKVAGTTIPSPQNSRYLHSNNRLTNDSVIERTLLVQVYASFVGASNTVYEVGIYDSTISGVRLPSRTKSTTGSAGRSENIATACVIKHSQGDYIEIWIKNNNSTSDVIVEDLNVVITDLNQ